MSTTINQCLGIDIGHDAWACDGVCAQLVIIDIGQPSMQLSAAMMGCLPNDEIQPHALRIGAAFAAAYVGRQLVLCALERSCRCYQIYGMNRYFTCAIYASYPASSARSVRDDAEQIDLTLAEHDQLQLVPSFFVWPGLTTLVRKVVEEDEEQLAVLIVYSLAEMQEEGRAPVAPEQLLMKIKN